MAKSMTEHGTAIPVTERYLLSIQDAARYISVSERTMQDIRNRPDFQYVVRRVGGRVLIHRESLDRWIDEHASTSLDKDAA